MSDGTIWGSLMLARLGVIAELAVAFFLVTSAFAKLASPSSVGDLLSSADVQLARPTWVVASGASALEIVLAVGLLRRWPGFAVGAMVVLFAFTLLIWRAISRGSRSRCGCLGDLTDSRVGAAAVIRNVVLIMLCLLSIAAAGPTPPPAYAAGVLVTALVVVVPDAAQTIVDLHRARMDETRQIRLGLGRDELL